MRAMRHVSVNFGVASGLGWQHAQRPLAYLLGLLHARERRDGCDERVDAMERRCESLDVDAGSTRDWFAAPHSR
jgi:hypothetical protein